MAPPPANKRQRTAHLVDEQDDGGGDGGAGLLDARILQPLVLMPGSSRSFLTTKETGILCLLTSKSIQNTALGACGVFDQSPTGCTDGDDTTGSSGGSSGDYFWRCLCVNYHRGDEIAVAAMIRKTGMSAKECFRVFIIPDLMHGDQPPHQYKPPPLPPLKYSPSDYVLIVQVWGGPSDDGTDLDRDSALQNFLFCETLEGQEIPNFFDVGTCAVSLKRPVVMPGINEDDSTDVSHRAKVQLMRKQDGKIIELFHAKYLGEFDSEELAYHQHDHLDIGGQKFYREAICAPWFDRLVGRSPDDGYPSEEISLQLVLTYARDASLYSISGFKIDLELWSEGDLLVDSRRDEINWPNDGLKFAHFIENMAEWDD